MMGCASEAAAAASFKASIATGETIGILIGLLVQVAEIQVGAGGGGLGGEGGDAGAFAEAAALPVAAPGLAADELALAADSTWYSGRFGLQTGQYQSPVGIDVNGGCKHAI
jgi:hypothetical protein